MSARTGCYAADMVWDEAKAIRFRQIMVLAVGRDCVCRKGESCWLMGAALKGVVTTVHS